MNQYWEEIFNKLANIQHALYNQANANRFELNIYGKTLQHKMSSNRIKEESDERTEEVKKYVNFNITQMWNIISVTNNIVDRVGYESTDKGKITNLKFHPIITEENLKTISIRQWIHNTREDINSQTINTSIKTTQTRFKCYNKQFKNIFNLSSQKIVKSPPKTIFKLPSKSDIEKPLRQQIHKLKMQRKNIFNKFKKSEYTIRLIDMQLNLSQICKIIEDYINNERNVKIVENYGFYNLFDLDMNSLREKSKLDIEVVKKYRSIILPDDTIANKYNHYYNFINDLDKISENILNNITKPTKLISTNDKKKQSEQMINYIGVQNQILIKQSEQLNISTKEDDSLKIKKLMQKNKLDDIFKHSCETSHKNTYSDDITTVIEYAQYWDGLDKLLQIGDLFAKHISDLHKKRTSNINRIYTINGGENIYDKLKKWQELSSFITINEKRIRQKLDDYVVKNNDRNKTINDTICKIMGGKEQYSDKLEKFGKTSKMLYKVFIQYISGKYREKVRKKNIKLMDELLQIIYEYMENNEKNANLYELHIIELPTKIIREGTNNVVKKNDGLNGLNKNNIENNIEKDIEKDIEELKKCLINKKTCTNAKKMMDNYSILRNVVTTAYMTDSNKQLDEYINKEMEDMLKDIGNLYNNVNNDESCAIKSKIFNVPKEKLDSSNSGTHTIKYQKKYMKYKALYMKYK